MFKNCVTPENAPLKKAKILFRGDMSLMILTEQKCWNIWRKGIAKNKQKKSLELKK